MTESIKGIGFSSAARVQRVVVERNDEGLTLSLRLTSENKDGDVEWRFDGVTQLRFPGESTELLGIVLLQFEDLTSLGWEGTQCRISDYEEEFIAFYCKTIRKL